MPVRRSAGAERPEYGAARRYRLAAGLAIAWAIINAASRLIRHPLDTLHDSAINLDLAARILAGALPYRDFFDVGNPPSVLYAHTIPVLIADLLHVSPIPVFTAMVIAIAAWSVIATARVLARFRPDLDRVDIALISLPVLIVVNDLVRPIGIFGQRDLLFILLYAPFFFMRALRWQGMPIQASTAIGLGLAAAIGISFKPYFAAEAVLIEAVWIIRYRRVAPLVAPEIAAVAAIGCASALYFVLMPAVVRDGYFNHLVPLVLQGYRVYDNTFAMILPLFAYYVFIPLPLVALGGAWSVGDRSRAFDFVAPVTTFLAASLAMYVFQHKGWLYHLGPFRWGMFELAALAACGLRVAVGARGPRWKTTVSVLALTAILLPAGMPSPLVGAPQEVPGFTQMVLDHSRPGDPILVLSSSVYPAYPTLYQLQRRVATRFPWTFPATMVQPWNAPTAERSAHERWFLDALDADLHADPPVLVFVHARGDCQGCPEGFTLRAYFEGKHLFEGALSRYTQIGATGNFDVFAPYEPSRTGPVN